MNEAALTDAIIETAETLHWRVIHQRPAKTDKGWRTAVQGSWAAGFPDLLMCRRTRLVFAELKAGKNKPSAAQVDWLLALGEAGAETYLWHENDWLSGEIELVLR